MKRGGSELQAEVVNSGLNAQMRVAWCWRESGVKARATRCRQNPPPGSPPPGSPRSLRQERHPFGIMILICLAGRGSVKQAWRHGFGPGRYLAG